MNIETIKFYSCWFQEYFIDAGMSPDLATNLNMIINCVVLTIIVILLDIVFRKIIIETFKAFSNKTETTFDDYLIKSNFPRFIAHLIPLVFIWSVVPIIFFDFPYFRKLLEISIDIYLIILCVFIVRSIIRSTSNYLKEKERFSDKPLESYVQVLMIFAWGIGIFFIVNTLTGYSIVSIGYSGGCLGCFVVNFQRHYTWVSLPVFKSRLMISSGLETGSHSANMEPMAM